MNIYTSTDPKLVQSHIFRVCYIAVYIPASTWISSSIMPILVPCLVVLETLFRTVNSTLSGLIKILFGKTQDIVSNRFRICLRSRYSRPERLYCREVEGRLASRHQIAVFSRLGNAYRFPRTRFSSPTLWSL